MRSTDKLLVAIVIGVVILVGMAFAVVRMQPRASYVAEEAPEGVAHNYLLALARKEYSRAYGYLSPTIAGYPASVDAFLQDVDEYAWYFNRDTSSTMEVVSVRQPAPDRAIVSVRERYFNQRGLFDSGESITTFDVTLRRENNTWKITGADPYWVWCWNDRDGCQ